MLKNQQRDQFATRVELSGNVHRQDISAFQAFLSILRNAFIEAFTTRFERPPPEERLTAGPSPMNPLPEGQASLLPKVTAAHLPGPCLSHRPSQVGVRAGPGVSG